MADTVPPDRDPGQLKNLLLVLEHARADAWLRKDRRALEALLSPDFVEINSLGRFDKTGVLDRLFPSLTLHGFTIGEPTLRITGPDSAVISYQCHEALTVNGSRIEGNFNVTAIYARTEKRYRLTVWEIQPVS
ncbi:MAG: nuclear transport factor 2 family protein [Methanoregula sp.]|jgi:hypothetical protein|uniref:nuclear transport factor 2 family protein n=1 Tax=Methanoregula sp. TaxID=2052170 RepID=UPI003C252667